MLSFVDVSAGYDKKRVLDGVSLQVGSGEVVAIIGPNGAGKSTALKAIIGLATLTKGQILFDRKPLKAQTPHESFQHGIAFVPQGRRVFPSLTVRENLTVGALHVSPRESTARMDQVVERFPSLMSLLGRAGATLSGGEQQMVAVGRALMSNPRLLLLDEPSLGLAPDICRTLLESFSTLARAPGLSLLIVEQKAREVLRVSNRFYGMAMGQIRASGESGRALADERTLHDLFLSP